MRPMKANGYPACLKFAMKFLIVAVCLFCGSLARAAAQSDATNGATATAESKAVDALPRFEVATVRLTDTHQARWTGVKVDPGGRVQIHGAPLKGLVSIAFHLSYWQISGGEKWIGEDLYDIEAKPPEEMQPRITNIRHSVWGIEDEKLCQMLQALLTDRFQLRFHREIKTGDIYFLETSGKPVRLVPAIDRSKGEQASSPAGFSGEIEFTDATWYLFNTSMPQLARFAGNYIVHRPVLDHTGLAGSFDYKSPTQLGPDQRQIDLASAFPLLLSEIGLKLQAAKGPVETLVIESAERPSDN
jgi:uncharacterized protein (TIGR03435 family)